MRITRKANGYTLRCNDSEFEALQTLVGSVEAPSRLLRGNAKNGYTRRTKDGAFLRVDINKR